MSGTGVFEKLESDVIYKNYIVWKKYRYEKMRKSQYRKRIEKRKNV